jgi:hypothetical protein
MAAISAFRSQSFFAIAFPTLKKRISAQVGLQCKLEKQTLTRF